MERISVIGNSGSGKSTLARALGVALGHPVLELDSIYHQPGWEPLDVETFRSRVAEFASADAWVVDGNYTSKGVADIVWRRADTVVWLDPPRSVVMRRVIARTLRRVVTREELWNGNRESWRGLFRTDPRENIVLWAWTRHRPTREQYVTMMENGTWSHLSVHRLGSAADVDAFLSSL